MSSDVILETRNIKKWFSVRSGLLSGIFSSRQQEYVKAVDGMDIEVKRGEIFAVVGESGCGKTTLARMILRLEEPTAGEIWFDGIEVSKMPQHEFRKYRTRIQMIFQDPYGSLNSNMRIGDIVAEPLRVQNLYASAQEELEQVKKRYAHLTNAWYPKVDAKGKLESCSEATRSNVTASKNKEPRRNKEQEREMKACLFCLFVFFPLGSRKENLARVQPS